MADHDALTCTCPPGWIASDCPRHGHHNPYTRGHGPVTPWPPVEAPGTVDDTQDGRALRAWNA